MFFSLTVDPSLSTTNGLDTEQVVYISVVINTVVTPSVEWREK